MIGEKIVKIMEEIQPIERTEIDEEKGYKSPKTEKIIEMTGAYRYALQQLFAIPIVDEIKNDDDIENTLESAEVVKEENNVDNFGFPENMQEELSPANLDEVFNYTKV